MLWWKLFLAMQARCGQWRGWQEGIWHWCSWIICKAVVEFQDKTQESVINGEISNGMLQVDCEKKKWEKKPRRLQCTHDEGFTRGSLLVAEQCHDAKPLKQQWYPLAANTATRDNNMYCIKHVIN